MKPKREVIDGKQLCIGCNQWLPLESFNKHKPSSTGRNWRCRECHKQFKTGGLTHSERAVMWAKNHPERSAQLNAESRSRIIHDPRRLVARREAMRESYAKHREDYLASHKRWKENNPWTIVADRARSLVRNTLMGFKQGGDRFKDLVGCDGNQFRRHIQSLWKPGMDWTNFGRAGWNIGHIKPVAAYKDTLLIPESLRECFHYTNLQPEWAHENSAKFTKLALTLAQISLSSYSAPHFSTGPEVTCGAL